MLAAMRGDSLTGARAMLAELAGLGREVAPLARAQRNCGRRSRANQNLLVREVMIRERTDEVLITPSLALMSRFECHYYLVCPSLCLSDGELGGLEIGWATTTMMMMTEAAIMAEPAGGENLSCAAIRVG